MDERAGRDVAERIGLNLMGSIGCLILAKKRGLIPDIRGFLDRLKTEGDFWVSQRLYEKVLKEQGEW
jgi:predicted nucleic acid-binding protein